jgi:FkbM family methyltransferase
MSCADLTAGTCQKCRWRSHATNSRSTRVLSFIHLHRTDMLKSIREHLPRQLVRLLVQASRLFDPHARRSYGQEGEDVILDRMLGALPTGFYVDVGAHHPARFSNTLAFYDRGWRGINIDPQPECLRLFRRVRPRDITIQAGVAISDGALTFYRFDDPALNTFSRELATERVAGATYRLIGEMQVPVRTLSGLLREHLPPGQAIDFMTIDAEGFDMQVLQSNDWQAFRPAIVLIEALETRLEDLLSHEQCMFMRSVGYEPVAKTVNTVFYRDVRNT